MRCEAILVDGQKQWIEREDGNFLVFVGDGPSVASSRIGVISRLRSKGHHVEANNDDERINIWRVIASSPTPGAGGTELGHYFTEQSAKHALRFYSGRNPSFTNWKVQHSRLTPDQYLIVNNSSFKAKNAA